MSASGAAAFFHALGDPTRLELVRRLLDGEKAVGDLVARLGCPQPKVSRHLRVLKEAGIVGDRKEGRRVLYALTTRAAWPAAAREWVDRLAVGAPAPQPSPQPTSHPTPRPRPGGDLETHLL